MSLSLHYCPQVPLGLLESAEVQHCREELLVLCRDARSFRYVCPRLLVPPSCCLTTPCGMIGPDPCRLTRPSLLAISGRFNTIVR